MKKIGILTYHHHYNYGTMLQALALQYKIEKLGYNAEIINFKDEKIKSKPQLIKLRLERMFFYIKRMNKYLILLKNKKNIQKKKELFEKFYEEKLKVGNKKYSNIEELRREPPIYHGYIVGSDQTWNPYVSNGAEPFFLSFVDNDLKKGSYAPSIAVKNIPDQKKECYRDNLSKFSFLSCREKDGVNLLEELTGKHVEYVLDPTLLLKKEEWERFFIDKKLKKPYILVYMLGEKIEHRKIIYKIHKETGWQIISLPCSYLEMQNNKHSNIFGGPEEFLNLIKGASLVCTDSFHGTIFSINFEKNFFTFCKTSNIEKTSENSRLYNVLELFGCQDRILYKEEDFDLNKVEIDYSNITKILNFEREKSTSYLKKMLYEITKGEMNESCN